MVSCKRYKLLEEVKVSKLVSFTHALIKISYDPSIFYLLIRFFPVVSSLNVLIVEKEGSVLANCEDHMSK